MRILFTILIFAGLFSSCSKSPKCWGDNKNKGIINESLVIGCFPASEQENYLINSDSAYQQIFMDPSTGEPVCELPPVDFNTQTLLGLKAGGQCNIKIIRKVTSLDSKNTYHYKVTVKSCGSCKSLSIGYNWVTVPKLPSSWTVTFETDEK